MSWGPGTGVRRGTHPRLEAKWWVTPTWGCSSQPRAPLSPCSHRARNQWDPIAVAWGHFENYISWIKIWEKIAFWKLWGACSNVAMFSSTFLAVHCICVSSQAKRPLRLSPGLTDDFLEFPIRYIRRKKPLTSLKSKIMKFTKLEIPLLSNCDDHGAGPGKARRHTGNRLLCWVMAGAVTGMQ